jgi:hypothetical protein
VLEVTRSAAQASEVVRAALGTYKGRDNPDLRLLDLGQVAALIEADFPTKLYYVPLRGSLFDTHVNQAAPHDRQPALPDAIAGFPGMKRIGGPTTGGVRPQRVRPGTGEHQPGTDHARRRSIPGSATR